MKTNRIFIIDCNWYLHRVWFVLKGKVGRPMEQALPFALLAMIMKDACLVRASHILVAFDGSAVFRYDLLPTYKANRVKGSEGKTKNDDDDMEGGKDIYEYLPEVRRYLTNAGVAWVQKKKYEADDVLASAATQYKGRIYLGSQDKDGYQVLGDTVTMFDSSAKPNPRYITKAYAEKRKGVPVDKMVMLQTLIGDKIDNVKQFMTDSKARKIVNQWGSIKEWHTNADEDTKRWIRANQAGLALNKQLVYLVRDLDLPEVETLVVPKLVRSEDSLPKSWFQYQAFRHPKSKGLF